MVELHGPIRSTFTAELEQLRLQVELMAVRVDQNLERMRTVLQTGDVTFVGIACSADDEIDAMSVSLTERCYDLLRREAPVASDLRVVVSVLRVVSELERVGDLSLRVIKLAPERDLLASNQSSFDIVETMADQVIDRYRLALRAWASMDVGLATELVDVGLSLDTHYERLMTELRGLEGPDAIQIAVSTFAAERALERIGDHASIIGARLLYLLTGNPDHLVGEVR
jgi:phosphate transport system protein